MCKILFFVLLVSSASSQETEYIQYLPGDPGTRFLVAAPHAGWMTPPQIRNRPPGGCWDYDEERLVIIIAITFIYGGYG